MPPAAAARRTRTNIASNLSGVFWAFLALTLWNRLGGGVPMLSVLVGAAAVAMVLQAKISLLGFIPGAFLGAATAVSVVVGASGTWSRTILALLIGAILGYLSEMLAGAISKPAKAAA